MCDLPDIDGAWMLDGFDDSDGSDGIDSTYDSDWFDDYSLSSLGKTQSIILQF